MSDLLTGLTLAADMIKLELLLKIIRVKAPFKLLKHETEIIEVIGN